MAALDVKDIEMGRQELIVYGKGSKERKTYLTDSAKFYLKRYLKDRNAQDFEPLFGAEYHPDRRLTVAGIQYMLRQLGARAGVKRHIRTGSDGRLPQICWPEECRSSR